jgi:hypothetical protein
LSDAFANYSIVNLEAGTFYLKAVRRAV